MVFGVCPGISYIYLKSSEMDKKDYLFLSTFYDKEKFRKATLVLNRESIDFQLINKASHASARAPLSVYFETDIMVLERDFDRAITLLEEM